MPLMPFELNLKKFLKKEGLLFRELDSKKIKTLLIENFTEMDNLFISNSKNVYLYNFEYDPSELNEIKYSMFHQIYNEVERKVRICDEGFLIGTIYSIVCRADMDFVKKSIQKITIEFIEKLLLEHKDCYIFLYDLELIRVSDNHAVALRWNYVNKKLILDQKQVIWKNEKGEEK